MEGELYLYKNVWVLKLDNAMKQLKNNKVIIQSYETGESAEISQDSLNKCEILKYYPCQRGMIVVRFRGTEKIINNKDFDKLLKACIDWGVL